MNLKLFEEENENLKKRIQEKCDQYLAIWERDFRLTTLISDYIEENVVDKNVANLLAEIKDELSTPENRGRKTVSDKEVKKLNEKIKELEEQTKNFSQQLDEQKAKFVTDKAVMSLKISKAEDEKTELMSKIKELEKNKMSFENEMLVLLEQIDRLSEENELLKYQIKNSDQGDKDVKYKSEMQELLKENENLQFKIAKLEGQFNNKVKEFKIVWAKMEYYKALKNV